MQNLPEGGQFSDPTCTAVLVHNCGKFVAERRPHQDGITVSEIWMERKVQVWKEIIKKLIPRTQGLTRRERNVAREFVDLCVIRPQAKDALLVPGPDRCLASPHDNPDELLPEPTNTDPGEPGLPLGKSK